MNYFNLIVSSLSMSGYFCLVIDKPKEHTENFCHLKSVHTVFHCELPLWAIMTCFILIPQVGVKYIGSYNLQKVMLRVHNNCI
jgi:hypothetical protein